METKHHNSIICAAVHFDDGQVHDHQPRNIKSGFVVCGRRHHNVFATLKSLGCDRLKYKITKQGFLTRDNTFVDRREAAAIAFKEEQIDCEVETLMSEDLY